MTLSYLPSSQAELSNKQTINTTPTNRNLLKTRALIAKNPVAKELYDIIEAKQTNLCVSSDVKTKKELLTLADNIGDKICLLKTHTDVINKLDQDDLEELKQIAQKHNFLIMEDRKFCDIGTIVEQQYTGGRNQIAEWADLVTVHAIAGPGIIDGLRNGMKDKKRGIMLVAQMSSKGNLIDANYTAKVVEMAEKNADVVTGFIAQEACSENPGFIIMTPGVNIATSADALGQQYNSPEAVIAKGTDIIIVGRGITQAADPRAAAEIYRQRAWEAYKNR